MATDIFILTIYLICVVYVLYQMALSVEEKLEDQVEIVLDGDLLKKAVNSQLTQQTFYQVEADVGKTDKNISFLKMSFANQGQATSKVLVQVTPQGKRPLKPPMSDLSVRVENDFTDQQVFVDWDSSSLSVHGSPAERVIRVVPGSPIDLFQRQVMTVANPKQATNVTVTSEKLFKRPDNKTALESTPKLVDFESALGMKDPQRNYSLRLLVWIRSMTHPNNPALRLLLPFNFQINVLPDHVALPILSWLLDFFKKKK